MCVLGGTIYFKMENERACEWVCLISVHTEDVCSYFMHLECSWQRATGTLTTQEWKASRSVWLGLSRVRERGCLACTESSPHLHTHTHTLKSSIQPLVHFYNQTFPRTRIHTLIKSQRLPIRVSLSHEHINIQCDHPHSAAGRRHSNSFHMRRRG